MIHFVKFMALLPLVCWSARAASWYGVLRDSAGHPIAQAAVTLRHEPRLVFQTATDAEGKFYFDKLAEGNYSVQVQWMGRSASSSIDIAGERLETSLDLTDANSLSLRAAESGATGGEHLSSDKVAGLPLNRRDFSQLLLLAAGAQTDTNGAANFTQQFAVNGQRGTAAVFAMDGVASSDPELGGATFSNFNVDAIEEIRSDSGVLPASDGQGAASFTDIITKSGGDQMHGAAFEFVRNAAFDARNFFDRRSIADPGRIPPFKRNEFGLTNGGPIVLPGLYDGHGRTYYFAQYQGFRQIFSSTQIISVPTADERRGLDTTTFPGDELEVPVNPQIASVMARYPLPNDPTGPYGPRTFAAASRVVTNTDQFSLRLDHRISDQERLFLRFSLDNIDGPLTNPSQTPIDPSFAIIFRDRQRNAGITYTRSISDHMVFDASLGYERSTPQFRTLNQTQPALLFADGLYEPFNAAAGTITGDWANLYQMRENLTYTHGNHTYKVGFEVRMNRDTGAYGFYPNGQYTFGGGTSYSPVEIVSKNGRSSIGVGDPLPDTLTAFLTASPFSYQIAVAPQGFPQRQNLGLTGIRREAYNAYFQDTWKASASLVITYGLRYEVNTPIREPADKTSGPEFVPSSTGITQQLWVNLQPAYQTDWNGWSPRLGLDWSATNRTVFHAAAAIMTLLPNLFQTNFITSSSPFVITPFLSAAPGSPVPFENSVTPIQLPELFTTQGQPLFATGRTTDVPANTPWDFQRFEEDLAALTPGHQARALNFQGVVGNFRNGYTATYSAGFDHDFGEVKLNASYVATIGAGLPGISYPNAYGGASPGYARFTEFNAAGQVTGGIGPELLITNRSHSTFHSLQTGVQKTSARLGIGFQANYTFSKSLDDASSVVGQINGPSNGTLQQTAPQNPFDTRAEKGPSTFDVTHVLTLSVVQDLTIDRWLPSNRFVHAVASGWQSYGVLTLTSGLPFTVYSGIQQTGAGSIGADRPDQVGQPQLSTSRTVREDYFGLGVSNTSYFSIPIDEPGGTGPNQGVFGALGRDTFRGPPFHNFDIALLKEIPVHRESVKLQFRAEFFNVFNIVNFGLPANILLGPGFGEINHTAGTSRQIQFSLKLLY
jgi:Carboxypeptidase regulatory-like domain